MDGKYKVTCIEVLSNGDSQKPYFLQQQKMIYYRCFGYSVYDTQDFNEPKFSVALEISQPSSRYHQLL